MSAPSPFAGLEPSRLWDHFAAITRIGRPSGEESAMVDYISSWARGRGFKFLRDGFGNVCVHVSSSPDREGEPVVVLQGHLDMVCVNAPAAAPDYAVEQGKIHVVRKAYPDGPYLEADLTTLGADNGIAVAAMCAIAEDAEAAHGPLDLLMTLEEETGMFGAGHLDPAIIRGRIMINLDSEDDDVLFVGCAGGGDTKLSWSRRRTAIREGWIVLEVTVSGLKGGHSGLEIDKNRLNGIKALARLLQGAGKDSPYRLLSIEGGDRRNAIPRYATSRIAISGADLAGFRERIKAAFEHLSDQYRGLEEGMLLDLREVGSEPAASAFGGDDSAALLDLLRIIPAGVDSLSQSIAGLVETSNNMGIVQTRGETVEVLCNTRSSVAPAFRDMMERLEAIARLARCEIEELPSYPGWKVNLNSAVLKVVERTYQRLFDSPPHVTAVHAGLEAGVISDKIAGMDVVSFGPNIRGAHAPGERVSINSVGKFYQLLKATLDSLSSPDGSPKA